MTLRQILLSLAVGQAYTFPTVEAACSARSAASKLYDGRTFTRHANTITRTA